VYFAKSYGMKFEGNSVVEEGKRSIHNVRQYERHSRMAQSRMSL